MWWLHARSWQTVDTRSETYVGIHGMAGYTRCRLLETRWLAPGHAASLESHSSLKRGVNTVTVCTVHGPYEGAKWQHELFLRSWNTNKAIKCEDDELTETYKQSRWRRCYWRWCRICSLPCTDICRYRPLRHQGRSSSACR